MSRRLYYFAALFAIAMAMALTIDTRVASYFRLRAPAGTFHQLVSLAEVFAHGLGVACILLAAYVLDVSHRRCIPRVVVAIVGSGLLSDLVKLFVGRMRPRVLAVDRIWDSFVGWLPKFNSHIPHGLSSSDCQSFPSGHAAAATALAIGLSMFYPRGRWLFAGFAVLASLQRIETSAHYVSDTMAGAAIACLACAVCFDRRLSCRWLNRWESHGGGNGCDFPAEPIP